MENKRILVVDDTSINIDILIELLSQEYDIMAALDGQTAIEIAKEDKPDLILLDIMMPHMDGFEVCSILKDDKQTEHIPIIFITAMNDEVAIERAYNVGGYDYISKPFRAKELKSRIKTQLKIQQLNESQAEYEKQIAMNELIHNIAHHWRQPLSTIATVASGISMQKEMGMISDSEIINSCNKINDTSNNLSSILESFKNIIDTQESKTPFNVKKLIDDNYSMLFAGSQGVVDTIVQIDEEIKIVSYPNHLLKTILLIISNTYDIFEESSNKLKLISLKIKKKDENLSIEIYDNAGGIDDNIINRIFEPYFTTKHKSFGKGMGLNTVQSFVVNIFKGSVEVYNYDFEYKGLKQRGLKFDILVPLV